MEEWVDGRTDIPSFRDARTHLKTRFSLTNPGCGNFPVFVLSKFLRVLVTLNRMRSTNFVPTLGFCLFLSLSWCFVAVSFYPSSSVV